MSGVYSLTPEDLAALSGDTALVAKHGRGDEAVAYRTGIDRADGRASTTMTAGSATSEVPVDGEPHLVTQTYDGMTYAVFVDGVETFEGMAERAQIYSDRKVLTTIGDVYADPSEPDELTSPFHGSIDEIQIAGVPFIPEFEAFRYANYFGNAVVFGPRVERGADGVSLALGAPIDGSAVEAGLTEVAGSVTRRSELVATIEGTEVLRKTVDAGTFQVDVPVNETGDVEVEFVATSTVDAEDVTAPVVLSLQVDDTTAPAVPTASDTRPVGEPMTLEVQPRSEDRERVEATFYANQSVALDDTNVVVRTGSTPDRLPEALTPASGEVSAELTGTTVGDDENPYQIYEIALSEEQAAEEEFHFSWRGTADDRRVSAWVWDPAATAWVLKDSQASREKGQVNLDVNALSSENAVAGGKLSVLIWRGLTELPWGGEDRDYTAMPSPDDYDWSFNHVGDTQLYAEATPWTMVEQFEYIRDHAEERNTGLVIQAGDWVNREHFEDEWQWVDADPAATTLEQADIPYLISWGNHDYSLTRNGRKMMPKYFPMERFEASLEGSPWTFGGSYDIDNYYYTGEVEGAKLLVLSLGFWSSQDDADPGITWAQDVIEAHPEHTVILATHDYMRATAGETDPYSNPRINALLVDPYPNVKLVFTGHNSGTMVSTRLNNGGTRVYGILTDYQTRAWGGHGFLKNISIDAENGLMYVNTWSPWLEKAESEGRWNSPITEVNMPGFHGKTAENYVLELDLGGVQTRTLATDRLTFAVGAPEQVGSTQTLVGDQAGSVEFEPELGMTHEWFAELVDPSGNSVRSATRTISRVEDPTVPISFAITYDLAGGTADGNPGTLLRGVRVVHPGEPGPTGLRVRRLDRDGPVRSDDGGDDPGGFDGRPCLRRDLVVGGLRDQL